MNSQWIKINGSDGDYEAYLSLPPAGKGPGLVLFQEIFGVNEHIRAVADQYALDGYVVLAPDVFWRQAPRVELSYAGADMERAIQLMGSADQKGISADIKTTVAALRARPEVNGKIGAFGFCMGGRLAYVAAAQGSVDTAVSYYGGGIQNQLDLASRINCPLLFHYAALDGKIPLSAVDAVRTAFAGKPAEFHIYPDADHGFNCWARGAYHQPSSALAHARTLLHFSTHLN